MVTGCTPGATRGLSQNSYPNLNLTFVFNEVFIEQTIHSMHLVGKFPLDDDVLLIESDLIFLLKYWIAFFKVNMKTRSSIDFIRYGWNGVTVEDDLILNVIPPHLQGPGLVL